MNKIGIILITLILLLGCVQQPTPEGVTELPPTETPTETPTPTPEPEVKQTIKIGFIGPLTGDLASIGTTSKNAVQMAVDEINEAGGINGKSLELIAEDGMCNPKGAGTAINKLINIDNVKFIIGGECSGETLTASPIAEKNKVIMISPLSSSPAISEAGDYIFRVYPSDSFQGTYAAEYVYDTLKLTKVAILHSQSDWGVGLLSTFKKRFEELGGTITTIESVEDTAKDVKAQITKIKATNPELIYMPSYAGAATIILKQAKEMGIELPLLNGDAGNDQTIIDNAGDAAEDALCIVPDTDAPEDWTTKFKKYSGEETKIGTPQSYDAVKVLEKALKEVGEDSTAVKNYFYEMPKYKGLSGDIQFDENGDLVEAKYKVLVIKDGQFEKVK